MAKPYTVEKEIHGVKYTAQFTDMETALRAIDESYIDNTNTISNTKLAKFLFKNIIVDPKCEINDFDNLEVLNEVTAFAREVMQGKLKPEDGKKKAE